MYKKIKKSIFLPIAVTTLLGVTPLLQTSCTKEHKQEDEKKSIVPTSHFVFIQNIYQWYEIEKKDFVDVSFKLSSDKEFAKILKKDGVKNFELKQKSLPFDLKVVKNRGGDFILTGKVPSNVISKNICIDAVLTTKNNQKQNAAINLILYCSNDYQRDYKIHNNLVYAAIKNNDQTLQTTIIGCLEHKKENIIVESYVDDLMINDVTGIGDGAFSGSAVKNIYFKKSRIDGSSYDFQKMQIASLAFADSQVKTVWTNSETVCEAINNSLLKHNFNIHDSFGAQLDSLYIAECEEKFSSFLWVQKKNVVKKSSNKPSYFPANSSAFTQFKFDVKIHHNKNNILYFCDEGTDELYLNDVLGIEGLSVSLNNDLNSEEVKTNFQVENNKLLSKRYANKSFWIHFNISSQYHHLEFTSMALRLCFYDAYYCAFDDEYGVYYGRNSKTNKYDLVGYDDEKVKKEIFIRSEFDGVEVDAIADGAFAYCDKIETVNFCDTNTQKVDLREIGKNIFYKTVHLKSIFVNDSRLLKILSDNIESENGSQYDYFGLNVPVWMLNTTSINQMTISNLEAKNWLKIDKREKGKKTIGRRSIQCHSIFTLKQVTLKNNLTSYVNIRKMDDKKIDTMLVDLEREIFINDKNVAQCQISFSKGCISDDDIQLQNNTLFVQRKKITEIKSLWLTLDVSILDKTIQCKTKTVNLNLILYIPYSGILIDDKNVPLPDKDHPTPVASDLEVDNNGLIFCRTEVADVKQKANYWTFVGLDYLNHYEQVSKIQHLVIPSTYKGFELNGKIYWDRIAGVLYDCLRYSNVKSIRIGNSNDSEKNLFTYFRNQVFLNNQCDELWMTNKEVIENLAIHAKLANCDLITIFGHAPKEIYIKNDKECLQMFRESQLVKHYREERNRKFIYRHSTIANDEKFIKFCLQ